MFFFPVLGSMRKRKRAALGHPERWLPTTLTFVLRGHPGSKDKLKRPSMSGLLPKGMNAASLRHSFGSLLLRSGKTYAQVAATMGNSEAVVMEHYARIQGREVEVNF